MLYQEEGKKKIICKDYLTNPKPTQNNIVPVSLREQNIGSNFAISSSEKEYFSAISKSTIIAGTVHNERIDRITEKLISEYVNFCNKYGFSGRIEGMNFQVNILNLDEWNALCYAGGQIFVNLGLINESANDDEIAAVIAHEIAHAISWHTSEKIYEQYLDYLYLNNAVTTAYQYGGTYFGDKVNSFMSNRFVYDFLYPFSRDAETEADLIGVVMMARAGYNPYSAIDVWIDKPSRNEYYSTHPSPETRVNDISNFIKSFEFKVLTKYY
ncbi:MAG: M48 family metallopeptidase [Flavobacteriales bacterium]|nr:M48 family metallopeptidase [Flavobacteriales bacterium]